MKIRPEIAETADGSQTLVHPLFGETYHSLNGAVAESVHVFIENGFSLCEGPAVRVFEVGFGSGLNALLTLLEAEKRGWTVLYTAVEKYPVEPDLLEATTYAGNTLFCALHEAPWGERVEITPFFSLLKLEDDLVATVLDAVFDIVYFDAFAPDCQPEMWSRRVFGKVFDATAAAGALVTYSAKGDVKRALRAVGYQVQRLPGAPGKRHMLRAVKPVAQL